MALQSDSLPSLSLSICVVCAQTTACILEEGLPPAPVHLS